MPKGVEHARASDSVTSIHVVIHSLMPKGVEHLQDPLPFFVPLPVIHSLMPKGVEHFQRRTPKPSQKCDPFVDAERR